MRRSTARFLAVMFVSLMLGINFACGKKARNPTDVPNDIECNETALYDISGIWTFDVIVTGGTQLPVGTKFTVDAQFNQSENGEITGTTRTEGGLTATLRGKVCGSNVEFELTQNKPCTGTFSGSGKLTEGGKFSISYSGSDCHGTLEANFTANMREISGIEIWSGVINVFSNITVTQGALLVIKPGTRINFLNSSADISIFGDLSAKGTADSIITFQKDISNPGYPKGGILSIHDMGSAEIEYCTFQNALLGIVIDWTSQNEVRIDRCRFEGCLTGILNDSKTIELSNLSFVNNSREAYLRSSRRDSYADTIRWCLFDGNQLDVCFDGDENNNSLAFDRCNFKNSEKIFEFYRFNEANGIHNSSIFVTHSYGIAAVDSMFGTNRLVVADEAESPVPNAGCGF